MMALSARMPDTHRIRIAVASTIAAIALAACGGGGSTGGGGGGTTSGWTTLDYSGNFSASRAQNIAASSDYLFVDANFASAPLSQYTGHPYTASRIHVAKSANLTGKDPDTGNGYWVQVVDSGFLTDHDVFAGTVFDTTYDDADPAQATSTGLLGDHGTHVASLIGANAGQMEGVAPDVNLVLSSGNVAPTYLANSVSHAASLGAVAQNNSWGYINPSTGDELLLSEVTNYMADNNATAYQALTGLLGSSSNASWQAYVDALNTFQDNGVIVWALSNDETLSDVDATAGFGVLFPELSEAYITVANALVNYTTSSDMMDVDITEIYRLSVVCGSTAHLCITADGTTWGAEAASDTDYDAGTGTSYAAPIVTGSVALVAEAFPDLSPEEWTKRLLASANMDIPGFTQLGTVDFGNGVVKPYDWQYGHGFLDVAAALSPIGTVSTVNGSNVETATRHSLSSSYLGSGGAFGDSVERALTGTDIAVFDALNGDFYIDGALLTRDATAGTAESAAIPRLDATTTDKLGLGAWGLAASDEIAFEDLGYAFGFTAVGGAEYLQDTLGLSSENVANASVLSLANDTTAIYGRYDMGFADFEHYGFIGTHDNTTDGALAGVGGAIAFDFDALELTIGASQMSEQGGYLGMTASDVFTDSQQTAISALNLAASTDIGENLALFGGIEYGIAAGAESSGYMSSLDTATFSGFQIGARATDLWLSEDRLTLTASQPLRVETGTMSMDVPIGRTPTGEILYDTVTANLAPSGRQLDLGISYAFEPNPLGAFELGFVYSLDAGHIAGEQAAAIGATFKQAF